MLELPIVDFGPMRSTDLEARKRLAAELRAACLANGFFYAKNTGVPAELADDILAASREFFARPIEEKRAVSQNRSVCGRGYEEMSGQRLEPGAQPDYKEGFLVGVDLPLDDPRVVARWSQHGPNNWPADSEPWRARVEAYHAAMIDLAGRIMRVLALSLDVGEDYFDECCRDGIATLRLLHYPPQASGAGPDARGAGAHSDWGAITILHQDDVGGLQVRDGDGWIDAPPVPGAFIVNLGDIVPRWTNGLYRSTVHRVINTSGRERYSIALFFDGRGDYVSEIIPSCIKPGETPRYTPISVNQHLAEMVNSTKAA